MNLSGSLDVEFGPPPGERPVQAQGHLGRDDRFRGHIVRKYRLARGCRTTAATLRVRKTPPLPDGLTGEPFGLYGLNRKGGYRSVVRRKA